MGEWLNFGSFNDDEDEYDEDGETADFEVEESLELGDGVFTCANCRHPFRGDEEELVQRTIVDITQKFPELDFVRAKIAKLTVRANGRYVAVEDACQRCWGRETWRRIQRAYGYQSRS